MKKVILFTLLIVSGLFARNYNCAMCHNNAFQKSLEQFTPQEISKIMMQFKNGERSGMTMPAIAKNLSNDEIKEVAKKYGKKR